MQQRVGRLEGMLDQLRSDHSEHRGHMTASHTDTLQQLRSAKDRIAEDADTRDRRATLLERQLGEMRGEVEKNCGLSSQMIKQTVKQLEEVQNRLLACEAQGANLQEVREVCVEL